MPAPRTVENATHNLISEADSCKGFSIDRVNLRTIKDSFLVRFLHSGSSIHSPDKI